MPVVTDDDVRKRREEVADQLGRHETYVSMLKRELADLDVAVAVMERMHSRPDYPKPPEVVESTGRSESTKPAEAPTVPTMIIEALLEAQSLDLPGMTGGGLTHWIRKKYWSEAPSSSITPTAWRMVKDGRLIRVGEFYAVPPALTESVEENKAARTDLGTILSMAMLRAAEL